MLTSKTRTVTISGAALPTGPDGTPSLLLSALRGGETLSSIYKYTLDCRTPLESAMPERAAANLDLKSMIGKELTITIELEGMGSFLPGLVGMGGATNIGAGTREISGIVTQAHYAGQADRQSHYQLVLKPWISLAEKRSDFKIYQGKTVVEIVEAVLGNYMYSYETRLSETYPVLDYQVQYGETDFRFIQRLMAEHGIYWFFEHSKGFHRMILVDQLGAHKPVESAAYQTLWYFPPGHRVDREHIDAFNLDGSLQSGRWTTNDFDFKKPSAALIVQNELPQDTAHNDLERYEWPGDFTDPSQGEQFARLRMEEERAQGERAHGSGNVRDIVCGTTFRLEGFPHEAANREYLVIASAIAASEASEASGSGEYRFASSFVVQPATSVFRPPRGDYPKPRTSGPQTAIVTGPAGQEIWTDQYGRVKLSFHWDRSGVKDQSSSCWVRVSYPWAGGGYGGVNIPRVGSEVIVDFENGDPDRPIVVGRLYNAETMPPWDLPGNATQSGMLSRSMKGSAETANGLRFEDKQGAEEVWLQAQKDMNTTVKNNESHSVTANRTKSVGGSETTTVGGTRTETVTGDETITLQANRTCSVTLNDTLNVGVDQSTTIKGNQTHDVIVNRTSTVGGNDTLTVTGFREETVNGTSTETVTQAKTSTLLADHTVAVTGQQVVNVGTKQAVTVGTNATLHAGDKIEFVCGAAKIVMHSSGKIEINGTDISVTGKKIVATGSDSHAINGGTVTSSATKTNTVQGSVLKLNP
ncbi:MULTISPECIES: type VI secretion system tip protein TssI/VgrG [unclassified Caballeronia]|uniref:type VI secretion system Vgr family protein n=1 Tax=unclassified Caballeronia TaxID=2646786 RepID=UPI002854E6E1|nr:MULTISPECIES: type VI secretion system tip protein TssI/VgrG [unclassified Caballeronia]MDR5741430.1 type VI secretion system tip protein TssI/VgrG [Caballeronia sp. LZ016]MDR5806743.1 type VI secretion system tip protein TssI/VgrG [Caballeronia sp. LZ019]